MTESNLTYLRVGLGAGALLFFLTLELIVPYRQPSVSKARRWVRNLGLTAFNNVVLTLVFATALAGTTAYVTKHQIGIFNVWDIPYWLKVVLAVAFLDFVLYVWHLLNHEMPLLWRFHRVHHADLNMDVSTATRFHLGELAISVLIKMGLIYLIGADLFMVFLFESLLLVSAQFHHSSIKVPWWLERVWWLFSVPPSMHRIHHSVVIKERNSNYGTIFSFWDRIFGTMTTGVDQGRIRIGLGAYPRFDQVGLGRLLVMPFFKAVR